jgi:serine/threonine-protein kinase
MCLVTELLNGMDLDDYLTQRGDVLPVFEIILLLSPIIDTLEMAHAQGVIHRDLKPGNIFIVKDPSGVRLLDFGFAKFANLASFTVAGSVAGSPRYIAPEAWMGKKDLDLRIDVYAIGTLIFRCLVGSTPFPADTMILLLRSVTQDPRPSLHALRPDLPAAIDPWLQQALAIDRDQRFQNVRSLWESFINLVS